MKHRIFGKKLGRNHNERKALFKCQLRSVLTYGGIETTETKAKALIPLVEDICTKIITKSDLVARRELFRFIQDQNFVNNAVNSIKSAFGEQSSNFTKITKIKRRQGDDSVIVKLSFVKPVIFEKKVEKEEIKKETKKVNKPIKKEKVVKQPKTKKETK